MFVSHCQFDGGVEVIESLMDLMQAVVEWACSGLQDISTLMCKVFLTPGEDFLSLLQRSGGNSRLLVRAKSLSMHWETLGEQGNVACSARAGPFPHTGH